MEEIKAQAQLAIDEADVIILVTDGRVGVTNGDKDVIKILHKSKKPVILHGTFLSVRVLHRCSVFTLKTEPKTC